MVDNSALSFGYHIDNGIPIVPFYEDPNDDEMKHLSNYIESIADVDDLRIENRKAFHLSEISVEEIDRFISNFKQEAANDDTD